MSALFQDRCDAGRQLARKLQNHADRPGVLVLALPRGGVPVGHEVAGALHCPLDIFMVRKLGLPGHEELAMGAIATGGVRVLNQPVIRQSGVSPASIDAVAEQEGRELERRESAYRAGHPRPDVRGKTVILVDDGIATGSTMRAAVSALKHSGVKAIIIAAPVASVHAVEMLRTHVDEVVTVSTPVDFSAVGEWYRDFNQTSDDEVRSLLESAQHPHLA